MSTINLLNRLIDIFNGAQWTSLKKVLSESLPYLILLAASLAHWQIVEAGTAFEGPGLDMVSYFMRIADPNFLPGDFLTEMNQIVNPRMIFEYLVRGIQVLIYADWYSAYFFLKVCFVILVPYSWARLLESSFAYVRPELAQSQVARWLCVLFVSAAVWDKIPGLNTYGLLSIKSMFSIAWWPPITTSTSPQALATCLGIFGAIRTLEQSKTKSRFNPFLILATFIHPTVCIIGYVFITIIATSTGNFETKYRIFKRIVVEILIGWFLPCLILMLVFSSDYPLTGEQFTYIYAKQAHPAHYWIQELGSFSRFSWKFAFFNVTIVLSVSVIVARFLKLHKVTWIAINSLIFYLSLPFIQYLVVDLIPIKFLVTFGPIRLSLLGYWLCIFVISLLTLELLERRLKVNEQVALSKETSRISLFVFTTALILGFFGTHFLKDDPFLEGKNRYPLLYEWISRNTQTNAIFAVPFGPLTTLVPLFYHRGVFAGAGFPFVEDGLVEFCMRDKLLYGDPGERAKKKGAWVGDSMAQIYHSRTPGNFAYMSKIFRLDYFVIESKHGENFRAIAGPEFIGNGYEVYSVPRLFANELINWKDFKGTERCN
jgi:hypothetical protein